MGEINSVNTANSHSEELSKKISEEAGEAIWRHRVETLQLLDRLRPLAEKLPASKSKDQFSKSEPKRKEKVFSWNGEVLKGSIKLFEPRAPKKPDRAGSHSIRAAGMGPSLKAPMNPASASSRYSLENTKRLDTIDRTYSLTGSQTKDDHIQGFKTEFTLADADGRTKKVEGFELLGTTFFPKEITSSLTVPGREERHVESDRMKFSQYGYVRVSNRDGKEYYMKKSLLSEGKF